MSDFLDSYAAEHAGESGVLYDVNGDNQAVGLLLIGAGALSVYEAQHAIKEDAEPYMAVSMPCGEATVYDTKASVPHANTPCSCGKVGHWFVYWVNPPALLGDRTYRLLDKDKPSVTTTTEKPSSSQK
jgi:hypothetical protein